MNNFHDWMIGWATLPKFKLYHFCGLINLGAPNTPHWLIYYTKWNTKIWSPPIILRWPVPAQTTARATAGRRAPCREGMKATAPSYGTVIQRPAIEVERDIADDGGQDAASALGCRALLCSWTGEPSREGVGLRAWEGRDGWCQY